nr:ABC transporter substrate-binding protein [uncultured Methanospirillum sp.]
MKLNGVIIVCLVILLVFSSVVFADRTITDSRGKEVTLPDTITSVVTISDSFLEEVMYRLGVIDTLVGVGTNNLGKEFNWSYETVSGKNFTYDGGTHNINVLYPKVATLPVVAAYNTPTNYEKIASLKPDVVIVRAGDCSFWLDDDAMKKTVERIESLGIPVVVSYGPNMKGRETGMASDVSAITDEISLMGKVYNKEKEASDLSQFLTSQVDLIQDKTKYIKDSDKQKVLLLGLSSLARTSGSAADTWGQSAVETSFLEDIVHAKNAFDKPGQVQKLNAEQVLSTEPDVILLPTDWGYHPARELYESPYYQNFKEMQAIKDKRVYALPFLPNNCDIRIEYPIELMIMAKAAYPDLFADVNLGNWILDYYKNIYGVDETMAKKLRTSQWLDWTAESS